MLLNLRRMNTNRKKRLLIVLSLAAMGMFGFSYLMVPFYNALCKTLGINGKTNTVAIEPGQKVNVSRKLSMQFVTTINANLSNWEFYPKVAALDLHPGENQRVLFYAKNNTDQEMTVQAIPSVTPGLAAQYVKKTECFCFIQQTLKPHETKIMPLLFHIDDKIPATINTLTLSYTLFSVKKKNLQ